MECFFVEMVEIIVFIFLLLFGFIVNRRFPSQKAKEILKNLIIFVGSPILIIHSVLSQGKIEFGLVAVIVVLSLVLNMVFSKIGNHILKLKNRGPFLLLNSFANAAFLGLPLCWIVFGSQGLYYGSLYVVVGSLVQYSLGIAAALKEEKADWLSAVRDTFKFPAFWVYLVVLLILNLGITLPAGIMDVFGSVGKIALYLIMVYVGLNLSKPENIKEFYRESLYVGVFRFLISPLIIFLPLFYLKIEGCQVLTFEAMMPPAIFNTIIAGYYQLNEKLCANITSILTILFLLGFILIELIGKIGSFI